MRTSLAVVALCILGVTLLFFTLPPPGPPVVAPEDQPAQHVSTYRWTHEADWFGGFSGIEITDDGQVFYAATDKGYLVQGRLQRTSGQITQAEIAAHKPLVGPEDVIPGATHNDAEGLALDADGRLFVSFEGAQRVVEYPAWDASAEPPSSTRAWGALHVNRGLEALAIDARNVLFTLPEGVQYGATDALVYRRTPNEDWRQPFTLPVDGNYRPVGGDFGPDGRFYLLERTFHWLGFRSRVRVMTITATGIKDIETVLETPQRRHGNLEGLAVWADQTGRIHLTMISDDNFLWILPTEITEYRLND
ncbi:esterase-like activity of phytase family protein [uncultured Roseobacter sp.]|uniref:esterase-like activity of phytase family protein n=1 Tax=uncultured Roseobacter sp. TaxID=114847 RepID=UPI00261F9F4F|nr:esterase-like activity of phytase family protein [uncultured Roseobacter sp.]